MANYEALTVGELLNTNNSELLNSVLFQLQVCLSQKTSYNYRHTVRRHIV